jgi:RimJ/RimL family protein N-acetyltransferase
MLDYGLSCQALHNLMLTVFSFNERGFRAYTRAGFKVIGRRREAHRSGGLPYDVIYMDCLTSEFPAGRRLTPTSPYNDKATAQSAQ